MSCTCLFRLLHHLLHHNYEINFCLNLRIFFIAVLFVSLTLSPLHSSGFHIYSFIGFLVFFFFQVFSFYVSHLLYFCMLMLPLKHVISWKFIVVKLKKRFEVLCDKALKSVSGTYISFPALDISFYSEWLKNCSLKQQTRTVVRKLSAFFTHCGTQLNECVNVVWMQMNCKSKIIRKIVH